MLDSIISNIENFLYYDVNNAWEMRIASQVHYFIYCIFIRQSLILSLEQVRYTNLLFNFYTVNNVLDWILMKTHRWSFSAVGVLHCVILSVQCTINHKSKQSEPNYCPQIVIRCVYLLCPPNNLSIRSHCKTNSYLYDIQNLSLLAISIAIMFFLASNFL